MATDMMMMMMIDDIRLRVTVMIDTASRTQGELPKNTKMGTHSTVLPTSLLLTSAFRTLRRATYQLTDVSCHNANKNLCNNVALSSSTACSRKSTRKEI